jgi:hypothetical protein
VVTAEPTSPPRTGRRETVTLFVRSMLAALRDSNETEALLTGEEISSVGRMRALVPVLEASEEGRAILRERPRGRDIDLARLRRFRRSMPAHRPATTRR